MKLRTSEAKGAEPFAGRALAGAGVRSAVCASGALLLMISLVAGATDLRGRVEGQNAYASSPYAINGARVDLMDPGGRQVASYLTGPDGMYYFRRISPGKYVVRVRNKSYPITVRDEPAQDLGPVRVQN